MSTGNITPNIQNYLNLIPPPNNLAPNFMAWVQALSQIYIDQQICLEELLDAFDINTAIGVQLDILGQIIGVSRTVGFNPSDGSSPVLTDSVYRTILFAQILKNRWDGTVNSVLNFWSQYLPQFPIAIIDNQDMTMTVWITGMQAGLQQQLVTNGYYVPKPAAVRVNYVFGTGPFFAWGVETTYLQGWGQGSWINLNSL